MTFIIVTGLVMVLNLVLFNIPVETSAMLAMMAGLWGELTERFDRLEDKLSESLGEDE